MTRTEYLTLRMQAWTSFATSVSEVVMEKTLDTLHDDEARNHAKFAQEALSAFADEMIAAWEREFKAQVAIRFGLTERGVKALEDNVQFFRILGGAAE